MMNGSLTWTAVGTTSPRNSALGPSAVADQHRLMAGRVARRRQTLTPGAISRLAVDQLQQPGLAERRDVLRQVAGAVALVRMGGVLPLARAG